MKNTIKNSFDLKAKEIERRFIKRLQENALFFTGNGKENTIEKVTAHSIFVKTETGKDANSISRKKIQQALSYLLYKRTSTRKELEAFSNFNSSLMGLLRLILIEIAKIHWTVKGVLRITIEGVRFFFSGLDRPMKMDLNAVVENQGKFILNSYYYWQDKDCDEWLEKLEELGIELIADSGGFSEFNAKKKGKKIKPITAEKYAAFINRYGKKVFAYFNLDVIGDPEQSKINFDLLEKLTGIPPIPIWHCNPDNWKCSDWTGLANMVAEDHAVIAIGATVELGKKAGPKKQNEVKRAFFKELFRQQPTQNFHWLGGSSNLLLEFPFFSADSSGWLQGRKKKQVYLFEDAERSTKIMEGWTPKECLDYNVKILASLEEMYERNSQLHFNL